MSKAVGAERPVEAWDRVLVVDFAMDEVGQAAESLRGRILRPREDIVQMPDVCHTDARHVPERWPWAHDDHPALNKFLSGVENSSPKE